MIFSFHRISNDEPVLLRDGGLSQCLLGWGWMCSYWLPVLGGLSEDFVGYAPYFPLPRPTPVQGTTVFWGWSSEEQSHHNHSLAPHLGVAAYWDWGGWISSCGRFWDSSSQSYHYLLWASSRWSSRLSYWLVSGSQCWQRRVALQDHPLWTLSWRCSWGDYPGGDQVYECPVPLSDPSAEV